MGTTLDHVLQVAFLLISGCRPLSELVATCTNSDRKEKEQCSSCVPESADITVSAQKKTSKAAQNSLVEKRFFFKACFLKHNTTGMLSQRVLCCEDFLVWGVEKFYSTSQDHSGRTMNWLLKFKVE